MTAEGEGWQGGGASLTGARMKAGDADAVRTFVAPESGVARIFGNPRLVSGSQAHITLMQGETSLRSMR